jgi:hypothetical protein
VEGTIGYEALFSAEEWDALMSGDYSELEETEWGQTRVISVGLLPN